MRRISSGDPGAELISHLNIKQSDSHAESPVMTVAVYYLFFTGSMLRAHIWDS